MPARHHGGGWTDAQGDLLRVRGRRRRGGGLARLLRRRGQPLRHHPRPVRGRGREPAAAQAVRALRHQDHLVRPRPLGRDLPRADAGGGGRRSRDRDARLQPREPGGADARAGREDLRQVHRGHREAQRQAASRLRRPVVGVRAEDQRVPAEEGHQVRPFLDAQGLRALLRPGRRQLDQDRLLEGSVDLDEAAAARPGDGPDRDPGLLVPRRPAADDVHQGGTRTATASSTRATSSSSGATSSTGSTGRWTMRSTR